ncbi:hypothetical protein HDU98_003957 [Podochytrium sp. JEL0797]|nr:hypothetical protein HDU98_003957 [Podochytrium sp. JEL0797]
MSESIVDQILAPFHYVAESISDAKKRHQLPCTGPFENLHRETKNVFPTLHMIQGAKFDITSIMSQNFQVSHSFSWGAAQQPPSYHFSGGYQGKQYLMHGQIDDQGTLQARANYFWPVAPVVANELPHLEPHAHTEKQYDPNMPPKHKGEEQPRNHHKQPKNKHTRTPTAIPYTSTITLKNKNIGCLLHSHTARYPLRYENGHVSSEGQQVTCYHHPDHNNAWVVLPVSSEFYPAAAAYVADETEVERGVRYLRNGDIVQLWHVSTESYLLTHDVASPLTETNMEITTVVSPAYEERYEDTLWRVESTEGGVGERVRSMRTHLKLVHVKQGVALHPNSEVLPEWGFKQNEVNGEKKMEVKGNVWYFEGVEHETIVNGTDKFEPHVEDAKPALGEMSFLAKFLELQNLMFVHNAALTTSHPYSSTPGTWPFVVRGVSFWENKEGLRQIYLLGNPLIWWFSIASVGMYACVWIVDRIVLRRQVDLFGPSVRRWYDNAIGFLFLAWLLHWIPFFLMGRMLFLHHYLPSFIFSTMIAAALVDFVFKIVNERDPMELVGGNRVKALMVPYFVYFRSSPMGNVVYVLVLCGLMAAFLWAFGFFCPLSYGYGVSSVEEVRARKWFKSWDLQHA